MTSAEEHREFGGDPPIEGEVVEAVEEARNLPAVRQGEAIMARAELSVDEVVAQKDKIKDVMDRVMRRDVHYGVIPGTPKPTLLKPGAEAIISALRLAPDYQTEKHFDGDHLTVFSKCLLTHITTGLFIAAGEGMCSSKEKKYAVRHARRKCPVCGVAAIIKGKAEFGGGWICWKKPGKSDGCGEKFADDDTRITLQEEGEVPNEDLPDTWNTVLKMGDKRALVAAVLNGTAASDVFTQDVEDRVDTAATPSEPAPVRQERPSFPVPSSWPKLLEAARKCDNPDESEEIYEAFLRAASYHLHGEESIKALTAAQRKVVFQKACGAVCWLHDTDAGAEGAFSFFGESQWRQAWASVLDGHVLEIPDYEPEPPAPPVDEEAERLAREAFAD
jgi:hypothetical protein